MIEPLPKESFQPQWSWSRRTILLLRLATFLLLVTIVAVANGVAAAISHQRVPYPSMVLSAALFFIFMLIGLASRKSDRLSWQLKRDAEANHIVEDILSDTRRQFVLYLRSFDWTGALPIANPDYRPNEDPLKELATVDLEEFLARGIPDVLPVIALGLRGEAIGAGRYTTDDTHWQSDVETLAKRAVFILIMPLFSSGTMWEMEMVRDWKLLNKTIVILPPAVGPFILTLRDRWQMAKAKLAEADITLPDFDPGGKLFMLNQRGDAIGKTVSFPATPGEMTKSVANLLSND